MDDSARSHTILRHQLQVLPVSLSLYFSSLFLFSEGLIYVIFFSLATLSMNISVLDDLRFDLSLLVSDYS